jgi:hypothetical protein
MIGKGTDTPIKTTAGRGAIGNAGTVVINVDETMTIRSAAEISANSYGPARPARSMYMRRS